MPLVRPNSIAGGFATPSPNPYTEWAKKSGSNYNKFKFLRKEGSAASENHASVALHWTIDEKASSIRLAVAAEATGWLGLGICEMGGMPGSDIVIFEASGRRLTDAHALAKERPIPDKQQDWKLIDSTVKDGFIIVEATRKLDTGDVDDWPIANDSDPLLPGTKLIAAWGDTEEMHYHGPNQRLQGSVRFYGDPFVDDKALFQNQMSQEAQGSILMKLDNFQVPGRWPTWYEHRCFTVSQLAKEQNLPMDKPLHLIGFEWLLDPGEHVHHIAVYSSPTEEISKCDPSGPHSFMHVYNKGQDKNYFLPPNVGMLLSDAFNSANGSLGRVPKSFRLEIHYENPQKIKGHRDNSGVRLHYTSQLRQHTGAIMEFGDPSVKLVGKPVGDGLSRHRFACPESCAHTYLPNQGITVLYEMLHMHTHGLTIQNVHKRNGKEIRRGSVQYYDFDQGAQVVKQDSFRVLPGDSFETYCNYKGDKGVQFGFEASREMCMAWLFYYPAANVHLSCSIKADEKECGAEYSSTRVENLALFGRTFGETAEDDAILPSTVNLPNSANVELPEDSPDNTSNVNWTDIAIAGNLLLALIFYIFWRRDVKAASIAYGKLETDDDVEGAVEKEVRCPVGMQGASSGMRRRLP